MNVHKPGPVPTLAFAFDERPTFEASFGLAVALSVTNDLLFRIETACIY
jgi:hypothetical protein